jgi:murein DD-endopeptidase MepM/ murein hydrolase activator NlpD
MALYAHLALASVIVRPGARVRAGQLLARSGNTGLSSGPHLHFAVQQNTGMKLISLPFEFRVADGSTVTPEEGRYIGALPALP